MTTATDKQAALNNLKEWVREGDTVFTVLRSVSRSGMSRRIDVLKMNGSERCYLTGAMACVGIAGMRQSLQDWSQGKGASIPGCGMDMGFHAVDGLRLTLGLKHLHHEWI